MGLTDAVIEAIQARYAKADAPQAEILREVYDLACEDCARACETDEEALDDFYAPDYADACRALKHKEAV